MNKEKDELFEKLMAAYLAGRLSTADAEVLQALLDEDSRYQVLYTSMVKRHAGAAIPQFESVKRSNLARLTNSRYFSRQQPWVRRGMQRYGRTVAATLVGFLVAFLYFYGDRDPGGTHHGRGTTTVSVPNGGKTKVVLPDETIVWLNATSTLTYASDFNGKLREVHLDGEGFFDVKHDERRPFFVRTDKLTVNVLGTTFNVKAYQDEEKVDVTLVTGKVHVAVAGRTEMVLAPDEQLVYQKSTDRWEKRTTVAARSGWWTSGRLYFDNESLSDIMKTLGRKFAVDIDVHSDMMGRERFSGSINPELNILEVLQYLDVDDKYQWQVKGHTITVSDKLPHK